MIGFIIIHFIFFFSKYVAPYNQIQPFPFPHMLMEILLMIVCQQPLLVVGDLNHPVNQLNVRWLNRDGEICPNENPDENGISVNIYHSKVIHGYGHKSLIQKVHLQKTKSI